MNRFGVSSTLLVLCLIFAMPAFAWWTTDYGNANSSNTQQAQSTQQGQVFYTTATQLNVHSDFNWSVVSRLPQSTRVLVLKAQGNWLKVIPLDSKGRPNWNVQPGFVYRGYLSTRRPQPPIAHVTNPTPAAAPAPKAVAVPSSAPAAKEAPPATAEAAPPARSIGVSPPPMSTEPPQTWTNAPKWPEPSKDLVSSVPAATLNPGAVPTESIVGSESNDTEPKSPTNTEKKSPAKN